MWSSKAIEKFRNKSRSRSAARRQKHNSLTARNRRAFLEPLEQRAC